MSSEEIMEILEAYDLTGGLRAAAQLAGCDHKTVAQYVALRDAGASPDQRVRRPMAIDPFLDKVEDWVDRSNGSIRADVVHDKLVAMGFTGSDRSTRRAIPDAGREERVDVHRAAGLAHVHHQGVGGQDRLGPGVQRAGSERLDLPVERLGHLRHLRAGQRADPQSLDQLSIRRVDTPSR